MVVCSCLHSSSQIAIDHPKITINHFQSFSILTFSHLRAVTSSTSVDPRTRRFTLLLGCGSLATTTFHARRRESESSGEVDFHWPNCALDHWFISRCLVCFIATECTRQHFRTHPNTPDSWWYIPISHDISHVWIFWVGFLYFQKPKYDTLSYWNVHKWPFTPVWNRCLSTGKGKAEQALSLIITWIYINKMYVQYIIEILDIRVYPSLFPCMSHDLCIPTNSVPIDVYMVVS